MRDAPSTLRTAPSGPISIMTDSPIIAVMIWRTLCAVGLSEVPAAALSMTILPIGPLLSIRTD